MVVHIHHRFLPFPRVGHILFGDTLEEIVNSPEYIKLPNRTTEEFSTSGASAMCVWGEKGIPFLIFRRRSYNAGIAAHESLHALHLILHGRDDAPGTDFATPLCKETNEVWAYVLEHLVNSIERAKECYDARVVQADPDFSI